MSTVHQTEPVLPVAEGPPALSAQPPELPIIRPGRWVRLQQGVVSLLDGTFGIAALIFGLALLSALPLLNLLVLGYLLKASARVAETGKWRAGCIGIRKASVLGSMVLGTWLVCWPGRFVYDLWQSALLINPDGKAPGMRIFLIFMLVWTAVHIAWSTIRGGRIRHFLWPAPIKFIKWLGQPKEFTRARNRIWQYLVSLNLPVYFWLGLRGFIAAAAWLMVPVGILIGASFLNQGGNLVFSLFGGCMLSAVILYLPFLEVRFAVENRFRAMFEVKPVRQWFRHAPVAFLFAFFVTLLNSVPLYALKVELTPQEVAWLPGLLFVLLGFPSRILAGWAVSRAIERETPRYGFFCWTARLVALPLSIAYVLLLYLSQFFSWHGAYSMLEQHAFLVPSPLLEWVWGIF